MDDRRLSTADILLMGLPTTPAPDPGVPKDRAGRLL